MTCFVALYDTSKDIVTSDKYYHTPKIQTTLLNSEALKLTRQVLQMTSPQTTNEKEVYQQLYSEIPHLQKSIHSNSLTTYGSTALILTNIFAGIYMEDKELATTLLKNY